MEVTILSLSKLLKSSFLLACFSTLAFISAVHAAPPVRMSIVPGSGSGMEQEVADRITDRLQSNSNIEISTVNPDWMVSVNIIDKSDPIALTIRVNGTYSIKTRDGHVIHSDSVQSNKQDFNLRPGTPAPLNKALVDSAAREVISKLVERSINPINDAVATEMETRDKIIQAHHFADEDKYDEGLQLLMTITPATSHFRGARELIAEYQMEQDALDLMSQAKANVRSGKTRSAIAQLTAINAKSKRYRAAKQMLASLRGGSSRRTTAVVKTNSNSGNAELNALEAQKRALDAQKRAIEAQQAAIKQKSGR